MRKQYLYGISYTNNKLEPERKRTPKFSGKINDFIVNNVLLSNTVDRNTIIRTINKKYKTVISKTSIYNILKINKITLKRTKTKFIYSKEKLQIQIDNFKNKINKINKNNIISIDETSIDTHIDSNYGWSKQGKSIIIEKTNLRLRYSVISAISNKKNIHTNIIKGSVDGDTFLDFIKDLVKKIPKKRKVYILLDNARIHHYTKLKEYIKNIKNIEFVYNVPYMPEYNPIERLFNEIKIKLRRKNITNNNIKTNICKVFKSSTKHLHKYFIKSLSF